MPVKSINLKRKMKKLKKQIDKGEITLEQARQEINKLYATGKIDRPNALLIDGILMRKDLRDAIV